MKKIVYLIVVMLSVVLVSCKSLQEIDDSLVDLGERMMGTPSTEQSYVVSKNISGKKKYTVLQEYTDNNADRLQKDAEKVLLKLGFSVIRPPARKIVEKSSGNINASTSKRTAEAISKADELNKDMLKAGGVVEKYYELSETPADYLMLTDSRQDTFKIVDKETKEILAIENTKYLSDFKANDVYREQAYDLFTTIGFEVKRQKSSKVESVKSKPIKDKFLAYKSIPKKPIFTVIQTHLGEKAKGYSTKAEKMLLEIGVSVVRPPKFKYVEVQISNVDSTTTKKSTDSNARSDEVNKGKLSTGGLTETYLSYHETTADYIFFIDSKLRSFKLVQKETEEILAIEEFDILTKYNLIEKRKELSDLLVSLDLGLKSNY